MLGSLDYGVIRPDIYAAALSAVFSALLALRLSGASANAAGVGARRGATTATKTIGAVYRDD